MKNHILRLPNKEPAPYGARRLAIHWKKDLTKRSKIETTVDLNIGMRVSKLGG